VASAVLSSLGLFPLIVIFAAAAGAIWIAGIHLSNTTDVLSNRLHLGEALGGLILLAVATNLPELAITVSAARAHNLGIAIGNILGGIAIQTVVLALLDGLGIRAQPLMYRAASLVLLLEAALVVPLLVIVIMGTQLSPDVIYARVTPPELAIVAFWLAGLWLIGHARRGLPWHEAGNPPDGQAGPRGMAQAIKDGQHSEKSTARVVTVFSAAALATLAAGVVLEESGSEIADHIGLSGVLFGATVLAAATALPEVSTGLASVRLGDYQLAVSDIFGGNAFLPILFLVASLVSGDAVLPQAANSDIYLTGLGVLLTVIYIWSIIFRPRRQWARLGPDSILVVIVYVVAIAGLLAVT